MRTSAVTQLTVLIPVRDGALERLREAIDELPTGSHSPFETVEGTHFARLVVIDHLGARHGTGRRLEVDPPRLLFAVDCDDDASIYLADLCKLGRDVTERIFGECEGYPGSDDSAAFATWVMKHQFAPALPFAGVDSRLDEVRQGLAERAQLRSLAVRGQGLDPPSLRALWREEFGW